MAGNFLSSCLCSLFSANAFIAGCAFLLVTAFPIAQITIGAVYMFECPAAPVIPVYVIVCGILALLLMGLSILPKRLCPGAAGNIMWTVVILGLLLFVFIWFIYGSYQIYSVYPPNYAKIPIEPNNNNSIYTPTAPDNKPNLTLQNQNQSLSNLNQTWVINNNQTLRNVIQTMALSNNSSKTSREHPNTPQSQGVTAVEPYCNRTVYLFAFWTTTLAYAFAGNALVIIICVYGFMMIVKFVTAHLN